MIKQLSLGPLGTNCYIFADDTAKEAIVVDPADDFHTIKYEIEKNGLTVKYIIITHAHTDHINALDELKKYTNAKIVISGNDGVNLNSDTFTLAFMFGCTAPKSKYDIKVNNMDTLPLGKHTLTFIMTPGHTTGSMSIYIQDEKILFSGDTLFYESVGRTDFPGGSQVALLSSIKNKLFTLPNDTTVYCGHGNCTTIGHEKESNFFVY